MERQALKVIEGFSLDRSFIQYRVLNLSLEFPPVNNCRSKQLLHFLLLVLTTTNRIKGANGTNPIKEPPPTLYSDTGRRGCLLQIAQKLLNVFLVWILKSILICTFEKEKPSDRFNKDHEDGLVEFPGFILVPFGKSLKLKMEGEM